MAGEIKSAGEATKIASAFLKQYYAFLRPISAVRDDGTWKVKIDVGLVFKEIAEIEINASTADITGYALPE